MLMRSTGLGTTELVTEIIGLRRQGDYLIVEMKTLAPVRWRLRSGLCLRDFGVLIRYLIRLSIIAFFLSPWRWFKKAKHPGDF